MAGARRGKRPGGVNRLESPYGQRVMVAPQRDLVVSDLLLGKVGFVPWLSGLVKLAALSSVTLKLCDYKRQSPKLASHPIRVVTQTT